MTNKALQEERMRGYFIQATKGILKGEGLRNLSVRNISREAGYSYTTLYNYFKDVNDLIFICVEDFQQEIEAFVLKNSKENKDELLQLKSKLISYLNYFVNYPGIFELFYLEGIGDLGHRQSTIKIISNSLDLICKEDWDQLLQKGSFSFEEIQLKKELIRNAVIGMLLLYLNRRVPESYTDFKQSAIAQIDRLLTL